MINELRPNLWQLHFKEFGSAVYVLKHGRYMLFDTSSKECEEELLEDLKKLEIDPDEITAIVLTHTHWDHVGNLHLFPKAKIYSITNLNELKQDFPDFEIIETPGHTRDSICILYEDILFSGDTIFDKTHTYVGRTDLPESDPEIMQETLEKLKKIDYNLLCPGHVL